MAFTITGNVTDLDMDIPAHVGLVVSPTIATAVGGRSLRVTNAKGRFNSSGNIVKDVPFGSPEQPWVIGVREGTQLRLSATTFIGVFPPITFTAPPDGSSLSLTDLVERTVPIESPSSTSKYVRGASAYEIALAHGFTGSEVEWVASLEGVQGEEGLSAYEVAVANGFTGTQEQWLASLVAGDGALAAAINDHVEDPEPHPAYDRDMPDLAVLFENLIA